MPQASVHNSSTVLMRELVFLGTGWFACVKVWIVLAMREIGTWLWTLIDMALGILFLRVIRNGKICIYNV
jgi:hypothetical protein